ncbi:MULTISPECIES: dynamin family protein [Staphylococcus]|uniref:dynamin family protein n=1 Tax=Staphylococcus TaxID=1279 RepID=UPI000303A377|nr:MULTISPECIES: dynamin family protein [Staphylococcus]MBM6507338.1 dynamin family protein [Staphylococcus pasteuri]QQT20909.1 dynamin family protein [Staphylococcus pasteuri]VXC69180.1 Dynamin family protein [Staphylococcus sp. 8AQ]
MTHTEQLDILYKLKKEVEKSNNTALLNTINQVIKKVYKNQFTTSFVGHFSAGKSTLINLLLEQDILPSSPVPTTSNTAIVSVSDSEDIIANLPDQQYTKLKTYDEVKQMNRQNIDVESVEINFKSDKFDNGFTFQDTPGVDSNVATHQTTTEQFMYTSNVLFYTVDYNHVQSALNFQFMKRINEVGIPVVFIINQIDKHNEDELSFDTFKSRVEKSINEWEIKLEHIYYVSKFDHPENQIKQLSDYLLYLDENRESMEDYIERTVSFITDAQLSYIQNEMQSILEYLNIEEEFEQAYLNFQQTQSVSEEAQLLNDKDKLKSYLKQKRKDILENAYIMTHDMREQLRSYLESKATDFKVGGFFNKSKKKEEAQTERLNKAVDMLQEKINTQIRQPMREDMSFLTRFINQKNINEHILNQSYDIPNDLVSSLYQPQTTISNTYVLTFSDEVVKAINQFVERQSNPLFEKAIQHVQANEIETEDSEASEEYQRYMKLNNLKESLTTRNYQHYYIHLEDSLDKLTGRTEANFTIKQQNDTTHHQNRDSIQSESDDVSSSQIDIEKALNVIEDIPLFERTQMDIKQTLTRLDQKITKIGVFGTFSAGKSSLINALLGGQYLVSSPNPTTAATTELTYGENSSITLKSSKQLLQEINQMLEYFNQSFDSLDEFINSDITQLKSKLEKNQLAFISAVEKHYDMYINMLNDGEVHQIDQDDVKKWSAEDEYATFVKTVHLQVPVEWLKGKIIVDSLGLHSNNQRHTNETEQILTSSDLILYVSYFNHSFTDNDKAFIEHMKDMNQLNENQAFKMIINAVDLAESEQDLDAVKDYVADALNQVQLQSDVFGVSSREALKSNDEGINQLKESIQHFVDIESKTILEQQMIHQLQQIDKSYVEMIEEFESNKDDIAKRQQKLETYKDQQRLGHQLIDTTSQYTNNEVEEQVYHLNSRLKLQLMDDIKSVYNSQMTQNSDFNEEKKNSTKIYLDQIHQRLFLEQSLITERIKRYFNQQLDEQVAPVLQQLSQLHIIVNPRFNLQPDVIDKPLLHIELNDMMSELPKQLTKRKILNPNSQKEIHEYICQSTLELLQSNFNQLRQQLESYVNQMSSEAEEQFNSIEENIQSQINELLSFNLDESLITQLKDKHQQLEAIIY